MAERSKNRPKSAAPERDASGRWLAGKPPGPGRPQGSRNAASIVLNRIMAEDGEAVVRAMLKAAKEGDVQAGKAILDRVAPARRGARVPLALPKVETAGDVLAALARVVEAMGEGNVSPEEAATMVQVIAAPRAVFEAHEVERRLASIEAELARLGPQQRGNAS